MLDASIDPDLACQILNSLGQPVAASRIVDGKWIIEYANPALARMLGVSADEIVGRSFEEFMHPADIPRVQEGRARRLRGITDSYEVRILQKDGSTLPVLITAAPRYDGEKVVGSIYVLTDLRQHYSILKQLENSERMLMDILEFMPDPAFGIDREGRVIIWNKAIEELTGVKKNEMLGKGNYECAIPFYGYRRPVLADLVLHGYDEHIAQRYTNLHREGDALTAEVFIPTFGPEGSHLWLKAAPVYDADGEIEGAIELIRDITENVKRMNALRESEQRFRVLAESTPAGIVIMKDERFVYINKAGEEILEYRRDELIGSSIWMVVHPEDAAWLKEMYSRHLRGEPAPSRYEFRIITKSGDVRWVGYASGILEFDEDKALIGTLIDITERKQAEEELRRLKDSLEQMVKERTAELEKRAAEMERFVYTVSHDLRRPLITISGLAGLADLDLEKGDVEKAKESRRTIMRSVENMDALLSDILELSR
ncbi:MAG: PAS domain S-box protein, partial [Methanothrix sp.]